MIRVILGLRDAPPSDAADALALAVTHLACTPSLMQNRGKPSSV
jgi:Holliday junction resolvasome RuvABC endonuclease subunit